MLVVLCVCFGSSSGRERERERRLFLAAAEPLDLMTVIIRDTSSNIYRARMHRGSWERGRERGANNFGNDLGIK